MIPVKSKENILKMLGAKLGVVANLGKGRRATNVRPNWSKQ